MNRILVLLSLPLLIIVLCAFAAKPPKDTVPKENKSYVIPNGIVGVQFIGQDKAKTVDLTYEQAKELMSDKVFFKGFDKDNLIFHATRYKANPVKNKRPWGTYFIEKIYRIKRSREVEAGLGISKVIEFYEQGMDGIRGGMGTDEVVVVLGKPKQIEQLGPFGAFDYIYDNARIRFLEYKVAGYKRID